MQLSARVGIKVCFQIRDIQSGLFIQIRVAPAIFIKYNQFIGIIKDFFNRKTDSGNKFYRYKEYRFKEI